MKQLAAAEMEKVNSEGMSWIHIRRAEWRSFVGTTKTEESVASVRLIEPAIMQIAIQLMIFRSLCSEIAQTRIRYGYRKIRVLGRHATRPLAPLAATCEMSNREGSRNLHQSGSPNP
ncbi:MAG: hypothetical protein WA555_03490 [Candidatus Sulfotelmatobacter sp.]